MADAVVIGAGPNGLVAANLLADAGWSVVVLEAQDEPGGAVRSGELTLPGFQHDLFSAFYPLGVASPALRALRLEEHGLRWARAHHAVAHPTADGRCATVSADPDETAASLDDYSPGDGEAWRKLYELWERVGDALIDALFTPFPPVRPAARLAAALGPRDALRFARFATLPVRRLADEEFSGAGGGNLLAGNALHADLTPEAAAGGLYGWLLCALGQKVGFPVPEGGAGQLTNALVRRLESRGGRIECGARVTEVVVRAGRAVGVRTADGGDESARRAVLADVSAPALFHDLLAEEDLPSELLSDLRRFQWDASTVKVDWALSEPIPWSAEPARRAGTVHVADGMDDLSRHALHLVTGELPDNPFLVMGQYGSFDTTRAPDGQETAWAYTHVPQRVRGDAGGTLKGSWDEAETAEFAQRMEERVEGFAPGFRERILARHVFTPRTLEEANANLGGGALNAGTAQIHQQLIFRPVPGMARPTTPIDRLYLASASAHPGGGVHGACGANAARVALGRERRVRRTFAMGAAAGAAVFARRG